MRNSLLILTGAQPNWLKCTTGGNVGVGVGWAWTAILAVFETRFVMDSRRMLIPSR